MAIKENSYNANTTYNANTNLVFGNYPGVDIFVQFLNTLLNVFV